MDNYDIIIIISFVFGIAFGCLFTGLHLYLKKNGGR